MTDEQLTRHAYPTDQETNLRDITAPTRGTDTKVNRIITRSRTKEREKYPNVLQQTDTTVQQPENQPERSTNEQEYVLERVISHGTNEDPDHPTASVGETTYQIRWFGCDKNDDTYEPIRHIPRNKIVSYYKRIKQPLPGNINEAQMG